MQALIRHRDSCLKLFITTFFALGMGTVSGCQSRTVVQSTDPLESIRRQGAARAPESDEQSAPTGNHDYHSRVTSTHGSTDPQGRKPSQLTPTLLRMSWPVSAPEVVSNFGHRKDPFSGLRVFHTGIDIVAEKGTPVYAAAEGWVVQAGSRTDGCGLGVTLLHSNQLMSEYCHLDQVSVKTRQRIKQGTKIGLVGRTGRTTGVHLHWEIRHAGSAVDPRRFVRSIKDREEREP